MSFPLLNVVAIGVGAILATVGTLLLLLAAFRQSVLWGLAVLFLPLGNIVFGLVHWAEAKGGLLASVIGVGICLGGAITIPELQAHFLGGGKFFSSAPTADPDAELRQRRQQLDGLRAAFAQDGAEMTLQYQALEKQRNALKRGDTAAITQFNQAAAAYADRNARRKEMQQQIESKQRELDALATTPANQSTAQPAAHPRVVVYTTSRCPACKAAKQFLAHKGVSYEEINVESSREGGEAFQKLGGRGVPLILVGEKRMDGFNPQALEAAL